MRLASPDSHLKQRCLRLPEKRLQAFSAAGCSPPARPGCPPAGGNCLKLSSLRVIIHYKKLLGNRFSVIFTLSVVKNTHLLFCIFTLIPSRPAGGSLRPLFPPVLRHAPPLPGALSSRLSSGPPPRDFAAPPLPGALSFRPCPGPQPRDSAAPPLPCALSFSPSSGPSRVTSQLRRFPPAAPPAREDKKGRGALDRHW